MSLVLRFIQNLVYMIVVLNIQIGKAAKDFKFLGWGFISPIDLQPVLYRMAPLLTYEEEEEKRQRIRPETCVIHRIPPFSWLCKRKETTRNKALDFLPNWEVWIPPRKASPSCLYAIRGDQLDTKGLFWYQGSGSSLSPGEKMASLLGSPRGCQIVAWKRKIQPQNRLVNALFVMLLRIMARETVFQIARKELLRSLLVYRGLYAKGGSSTRACKQFSKV